MRVKCPADGELPWGRKVTFSVLPAVRMLHPAVNTEVKPPLMAVASFFAITLRLGGYFLCLKIKKKHPWPCW